MVTTARWVCVDHPWASQLNAYLGDDWKTLMTARVVTPTHFGQNRSFEALGACFFRHRQDLLY
jgi:hypothetical protein